MEAPIRLTMPLLLLSAIYFATSVQAHSITLLDVPPHADPRAPTPLSCHFRMGGAVLHSLKWYRDSNEIFRYMPSEEPSTRWFNVSGATVAGGACSGGVCTVRLLVQPAGGTAQYRCEVSTEGPKFQIVFDNANMTVAALPHRDPLILGAPDRVRPGDELNLNCSADYSFPPADIYWMVNDEKAPFLWMDQPISSKPTSLGLRARTRVLHLQVRDSQLTSGVLKLRCEAVMQLPPPLPAVRTSSLLIPVHPEHTQISMFVSKGGGSTKSTNLNTLLMYTLMATLNLLVSKLGLGSSSALVRTF